MNNCVKFYTTPDPVVNLNQSLVLVSDPVDRLAQVRPVQGPVVTTQYYIIAGSAVSVKGCFMEHRRSLDTAYRQRHPR